MLRVLSNLSHMQEISAGPAGTGIITALPYIVEYALFTLLAFQWASLVSYASGGKTARVSFSRFRPAFLVFNALGDVAAVALFVAFTQTSSSQLAIAGTAVLSFILVVIASSFLYYSQRLVNVLESSASSTSQGTQGVIRRTEIAGLAFGVCFILEALFDVLSVVQSSGLFALTLLFCLCDCCALVVLLAIYRPAVKKLLKSMKGLHSRTESHFTHSRGASSISRQSAGHSVGSIDVPMSNFQE
jgi:hypothetical protein